LKMIRAVIRPEREEAILKALEEVGIFAVTKFPVQGRGRQKGIQVGKVSYDLLAKVMLVLVVEENDYSKAVAAIERAGDTGHPGDGKIFVQEVSESYTIRNGERKLS
jgi:nitrogen regulatory protein PII 1